MLFDRKVYVYDKGKNLLAIFDSETEGISTESMEDLMVSPKIRLSSGEIGTFTFQMLAKSSKFATINNPENLFYVNGRYFSILSESSVVFEDNNGVSVATVTAVETPALLSRQYHQVYNCSVYCYAIGRFNRFVNDGAEFTISASRCSAIGDVISTANAWEQVKNWTPKDANGNQISYAIASSDERKPTNWEKFPSGVFFKSFTVSGSNATVVIESRAKQNVSKVFQYASNGQYNLGETPIPSTVSDVKVNSTIITKTSSGQTYNTSDKTTTNYSYNASTGILTLRYYPASNETINAITISYTKNDLGIISSGATCTFAYGAEAIDEHTFVVLPKANKKYKLTIDGVQYEDTQVKDSRGIIMPRGSGGYAMWAALKGTGWTLGICDVIALDFDASIDYGCFNVESDMKDTLSNIRYIQQLYGGILDWDSENKILNYRAENYDHYQAYKDGFNEWKGYVFREGKNMTARPVITYDNNIITRAYLLGYGNLNVRKVNNGKTYVENFDYTKDVYEGYLKQELIYDTRDEGGMKQLLYWGKKELEKQSRPRKNVRLEVTDVRTVEGLEHEVFDINDIVKVYYHDESTNTDVIEEQRVVLWEYNAFAMWDCTVELGDKTVNEVELFKLIYNKSLNTPGTDGSGNISSGNITVGGGGDYWNQNSLTSNLQLISRTTTDNSDAIAGLIIETDAFHAQADLFAYYQKQTDNMFSETYAAFHVYADEKKAEAIAVAEGYWEKTQEGLRQESYARGQLGVQLSQEISTLGGNLEQYWKETKNGLSEESAARARMEINLRKDFSDLQFNVQQQWIDINGKITTAQAGIDGLLSKDYTYTRQFAELDGALAEVKTWVRDLDGKVSGITIRALDPSGTIMAALQLDSLGNIVLVGRRNIDLSSANSINLQSSYIQIGVDSDTSVTIRGQRVYKMQADIQTLLNNHEQIYYFGWGGRYQ